MNPTAFAGKSALVVGGSSGIGLAIALQLATQGAHIWLLARDPLRLDAASLQVRTACRAPDQQVLTFSCDITDFTALQAALQPALDQYGTPDLLFNCAGNNYPAFFMDVDLEIHHQMMAVNYFGTLYTTRLLVPGMVARHSGHIVNISSMAGYHGILGYSSYSPSKFAVRGLSDVLYYELKPQGVNVSVVFPGDTDTPQLEAENKIKPALLKALSESNTKVMQPAEVARSILSNIQRKRYLITPGADSSLFYLLNSLPRSLPYRIMEFMITDARRKLARHQTTH